MKKTNIITTIIILLIIAIGAYFLFTDTDTTDVPTDEPTATDTAATTSDDTDTTDDDDTAEQPVQTQSVIGSSVEDRDITAYHFGTGETELLFVGGIHGAYAYNTTLLSYDLIDYLEENPDVVPDNVSVTVIPVLNPDGLYTIAGTTADNFTSADMPSVSETVPGRFNANEVDLNRNFACNWQSTGMWQSQEVDAGDGAFSEPEAQAMRSYVETNQPDAAVVFYAAAGGVYSSSCNGPVLSETNQLMNTYAQASGYSAEGEFTAYEIDGDMVNWMASQDIPAISVLLSNHTDAEFGMNRAGLEAILNFYAN